MPKNTPNDQNGPDKSPTAQKTIAPGKTVNNAPDPGATMIGGADTVEDAKDLEPAVDASQQTVNASPDAAGETDQASVNTFISSPDINTDEDDAESADTQVREISDEQGAHPTLDMDTATPDQTLIVEMDGGGETFIGQPDQQAGSKDLEDHFDTLIEDAQNPGTSPADPAGFVIGDYQVLKELGRGGMGVVYKARHRKLNREVALKMILAGPHAGNEALERFIIEARAVAHLQHPGIVQIFDIGEHEGLPYFSLEFVDGCDLQQKLKNTPQDPKESAELVEKLCHAMKYAHDNNILHRDIKPPNVLLDKNGEPKITDFGLAKEVSSEDASTATQAGTIMGSPSYMPPEQARGEVSSVTPRSDLYSLGAVLYEMLTGRPPFLAPRPLETVMQVVNNEPVPPRQLLSEIPVDLETICLKALQKDQGARYQSCGELAADLRRFINDEPILARPISKVERLWKWCKRNPKIALPSGLAATAIAATAVIATWAWQATSAQAAIIAMEKEKVEEQRDEAEKQKLIAVEERDKADKAAELAQKQAGVALDSIQYVVTTVDDMLVDKPQLTDIRIALLKAVSKKWDELDVELVGGVEGEAIPTLMAIRHKIAIAYENLDQIEAADKEFSKLYEKGKRRVQVKGPTDSTRSNIVKIALAWAPVHKRAQGDSESMLKLMAEARDVAEDILQNPNPLPGSPSLDSLVALRAAVSQNIGVEHFRNGELKEAAKYFGESLSYNGQNLAAIRKAPGFAEQSDDAKDSATANKQLEYDRAAVALASIQVRLGQPEEAIELYQKAIETRREIFDRRPQVGLLKSSLSGFAGNFGNSYLLLDQPEEAEPLLEEALKLDLEVYEQDPQVAAAARAAAQSYYRIGMLRDIQGKKAEAEEAFRGSRDIRAALLEKSDDLKNQAAVILAEARLGNVASANNIADEMIASDGMTPAYHLDRARALAQLTRHAAEGDEKQKAIDAALAAIELAVDSGFKDPFKLQHEPDLSPLHDELRFKALVTRLETTKD